MAPNQLGMKLRQIQNFWYHSSVEPMISAIFTPISSMLCLLIFLQYGYTNRVHDYLCGPWSMRHKWLRHLNNNSNDMIIWLMFVASTRTYLRRIQDLLILNIKCPWCNIIISNSAFYKICEVGLLIDTVYNWPERKRLNICLYCLNNSAASIALTFSLGGCPPAKSKLVWGRTDLGLSLWFQDFSRLKIFFL